MKKASPLFLELSRYNFTNSIQKLCACNGFVHKAIYFPIFYFFDYFRIVHLVINKSLTAARKQTLAHPSIALIFLYNTNPFITGILISNSTRSYEFALKLDSALESRCMDPLQIIHCLLKQG